MSALPPKADIGTQSRNVRFVPKADLSKRSKKARSRTEFGVHSPARGRRGALSSQGAGRPVLDAPLAHQSGGLGAFDLTN
jgi:hypothetical protein